MGEDHATPSATPFALRNRRDELVSSHYLLPRDDIWDETSSSLRLFRPFTGRFRAGRHTRTRSFRGCALRVYREE